VNRKRLAKEFVEVAKLLLATDEIDEEQDYITLDEMENICASCAEKMRESGIERVSKSILEGNEKEAAKWEGPYPKGWTKESLKKYWNTLVGDLKHKVSACMRRMEGKVSDPGGFCAALADRVDPGWRSRV